MALATCVLVGMSVAAIEPLTFLLCGILLIAVAGGMTVLLAVLLSGKKRNQRNRKEWMAIGISVILCVSILISEWPLRIAYMLSRSAMEQAAANLKAGEPWNGPQRLGVIYVRQAELNARGTVCFWTDLDPSGRTGFVQCPAPKAEFNLWSRISLDGGWQLISED